MAKKSALPSQIIALETYIDKQEIETYVSSIRKVVRGKGKKIKRNLIRSTLVTEASNFFETVAPLRRLSGTETDAFTKGKSAPDAVITFADAVVLFGQEAARASELGLGAAQTDKNLISTEFKTIAIGKGQKLTTITEQRTAIDLSFVPGMQEELDADVDPKRTKTALSGESVRNWMFSGQAEDYKNLVINVINEKLANYVVFNYLDKLHGEGGRVPKVFYFPGAAKHLNIRDKSRFEKYITVSPDKSKSTYQDGVYRSRVQFKLSKIAENELENKATETTKRFWKTLGPKISKRFVRYVMDNLGDKVRSVEFLEELLLFARELDPSRSETALVMRSEIPKATMGAITSSTRSEPSSRKKSKSIQATISSAQLTASVQRSLYARMPKGPLRGEPLSDEILTNRSGRFVKSVVTQVRDNLIRYFYNPIYKVHESTGRDPSETIEESIRTITQRQVGRQFNIVKGI